MRKVTFYWFALTLAAAVPAHGIELADLKVDATIFADSAKDKFKIAGRLVDADVAAIGTNPMTIRFGDVVGRVPTGGFKRRGRKGFAWKGFGFGVKKVALNVKKSTVTIVGGGLELGDLAGPVTVAMATAAGTTCGELVLAPKGSGNGRKTRLRGETPLDACSDPAGGADGAPEVLIMTPTPLPGLSTGDAAITLAGSASDDVAIVSLAWSSDRGGGGALTPAASWTIPDVALQPGDNRITVTATDADANTAEDTLDVVYNENGIVFEGMPFADPAAMTLGPRRLVSIAQAIAPNADLDPASVELFEIAEDGTPTSIGPMVDDGKPTSGDKIQGDGRWSARAGVDGDQAGVRRFRVAAHTLSAPAMVAWSPIVGVHVTEAVSRDALADAIAVADDAAAMLTRLVAEGRPRDEILENVSSLRHVHELLAVGLSTSGRGAWWVTSEGLLGGAFAETDPAPAAASAAPRPLLGPAPRASIVSALPGGAVQVGSRRSLLLAPYLEDSGPTEIAAMLDDVDCPRFDVTLAANEAAGAERFQDLESYGIVVITTHGDGLFGDIGPVYQPEWGWNSTGAQSVLLTGTTLSHANLSRWQQELRLGRMAVMPGGRAAVLPAFIAAHNNGLPGSLVFLGVDNATANETLTTVFSELGATTVLGFDGWVDPDFVHDRSVALFTQLLAGGTVGDVFTPGQTDGGTPPAAWTLAGSDQTSIATDVIVNGSFEFTSGFVANVTGFTVTGDGHVVRTLGTWTPTDGDRMALVSTGLGLTTAVGAFEQAVCIPSLPPGATTLTLSYDWNFFSEEFIEFCGSEYQDSFEVSLDDTSLQSTAIDDICDIVVPDPLEFDQGDVWTTGWLPQAIDVTSFAGTTSLLDFAATDVGDSVFDSVILVDDVRLTAE